MVSSGEYAEKGTKIYLQETRFIKSGAAPSRTTAFYMVCRSCGAGKAS